MWRERGRERQRQIDRCRIVCICSLFILAAESDSISIGSARSSHYDHPGRGWTGSPASPAPPTAGGTPAPRRVAAGMTCMMTTLTGPATTVSSLVVGCSVGCVCGEVGVCIV